MKTITSSLLFLLLMIMSEYSYSQRYEWMELYSSSSFTNQNQATKVFENNVYTVGEFRGSVSFGSTVLTSSGSITSIYIANYDTLGNFRWAIKGGSNFNAELFRDFEIDQYGNLYITGQFTQTTNWGTITLNASGTGTSSFSREGFIVKLNPQGVTQWIKGLYSPTGTFGFNDLNKISVADSTLFFTGQLTRTIQIQGSTIQLVQNSSPFFNNVYVGRLDLAGNVLSLNKIANTTTGTSSTIGDIKGINNTDYIFSGSFRNTYTFGSNNRAVNASPQTSVVVAKFSGTNCDWATFSTTTASFTSTIFSPQLALCSNGDVVVSGIYRSSMIIQGQSITPNTSASSFDNYYYAARINPSGNLIKLKGFDITGNNLNDIVETSKGEIIIVGNYTDSVEYNGIKRYTNGSNDIMILNLDNQLEVNWFQTGGGGNFDYGLSVASYNSPSAYILGTFNGLAQFGSTFFSGLSNASTTILIKMTECGTSPIPLSFVGDTNLCAGQSVRIVATPSSASTFQWINNNSILAGEIFRDIVTNSSGNYQIIVNGAGCIDTSRVVTVTVGTPPTVTLTLPDTVCQSDLAFTLSGGLPLGGNYSGIGVVNNQFDPALAGIGRQRVTYTFSNGGCADSAFAFIYVKPAPSIFFAPLSNVCITSAPITLTNAFPFGGVFSGNGVTGNQFSPSVAGGGPHVIRYTFTDGNGCSAFSERTIIVDTIQTAALTAVPVFCSNSSSYTLIEGSPLGGIYQGVGVVNGVFDPNSSGAGTFTIRYIVTNQCGSDTAAQLVTVNPAPTVSLGSFSDICEGSPSITLSGGTPIGGTYSGIGVTGTQFNPSVSGVGTFKIYYDYTDGIGCSSRDSSTITVNPLPSITLTPDTSICDGSSIALTAVGGSSYLWSTSATTASIVVTPLTTTKYYVTVTGSGNCSSVDSVMVAVNPAPTASITGTNLICEGTSTTLTANGGTSYLWSNASTTAGITVSPIVSTTYSVTITDANGCTASAAQLVTVNPAPTVSLGSFSDICEGSPSITLSGGTPIGGTYSGIGVTGTQFNPSVSGVGTFKIYYDYTDGIGCSSRDSSTITVNPLPSITLTPDTSICDGSSIALTAVGGSSYLWSTSATTASIVVTPLTTTKYYVTVTGSGNCSSVDSVMVAVNPAPTASITGTNLICEGTSTTLTANGGTSYLWSNASTTAGITVSPIVSTTYSVTITDANGCTASAAQLVTVNPAPTVSLGSFSDICEGSPSITLSGGTPIGGTYSGIGVTGTQFNPSVSGVGTFKIYYDYTDGIGCSSRDSSTITVNPLPSITLTPDTSICDGSSIALTAVGGSSYLWSTSATTASIVVTPLTTTKYYVTVTGSGNCSSVDSVMVAVNPAPTASITGTNLICEGTSTTLTANGGTSYLWSNASTTAGITVSPIVSTTYSVTITDANGCTASAAQLVTVNPAPTVSLGSFSDICEGSPSITLSGGTPIGGTYSGIGVTGTQFNPSVSGVGTFKIYYDYTDGIGCSSRDSSTITVNPLPSITLTPDTSICDGSSITLTAVGGSSYLWSTSATTASISVTPTSNTKYYVTVSNTSNCSSIDTVNVSVVIRPTLTVSNDTTICLGDTIQLSANSATNNYLWNTSETTSSIRVSPVNTTSFIVRSFSGTSCFVSASVNVTVSTGIALNIGADALLNAINNTSVTYTARPGFTRYLWQDNSTNRTLTVNYDPAKAGMTDTISVIAFSSTNCPSVDTAIVTYDVNTGISSKVKEEAILIYPNPVVDEMIIAFGQLFNIDRLISIYDIEGRLVLQQVSPKANSTERIFINNSRLEKGLYTVRITGDSQTVVKKFIIK